MSFYGRSTTLILHGIVNGVSGDNRVREVVAELMRALRGN